MITPISEWLEYPHRIIRIRCADEELSCTLSCPSTFAHGACCTLSLEFPIEMLAWPSHWVLRIIECDRQERFCIIGNNKVIDRSLYLQEANAKAAKGDCRDFVSRGLHRA